MNEGYDLYTFNMIHSPKPHNPDVAAIKGFEHRIEKRYLRKEGSVWYADITGHAYPDELTFPGQYTEGVRKAITVNAYERNTEARKACIQRHGTICKGCGFDFEKTYGEPGKDFIHVHHITLLATTGESYKIDPGREAREIFDYIECFITVSVDIVLALRCHRQNMKTNIINDSEVSGLPLAIHVHTCSEIYLLTENS